MGLNPEYIPAFTFQEQLVNKTTGLPLAAGVVTFYKDQARTQLKNVYMISGTPPNYIYTALPNPLILSANGTFIDNAGNDIVPYFHPYDIAGNIELYYVTVYSSGAVFQFDREGQPNEFATTSSILGLTNYIPNSQHWYHVDIPDNGLITGDHYQWYGGWSYYRDSLLSTDYLTFDRIGSYVVNPSNSPRYAVRVKCTNPNLATTQKRIDIRFRDVNKFASLTQKYTFTFSAVSNAAPVVPISFELIKYFGAGGSSETFTLLNNFNLTNSYTTYSTSFIFGDNTGKTIGTGDDDTVSLSIFLPLNSAFDISFTDFSLLLGDISVSDMPIETNEQMDYRSIAGELDRPAVDGSNLYLPVISTPYGLSYDTSIVGKIFPCVYPTPGIAEALCDGTTYFANDYDALGIPYSRLADKLFDVFYGITQFGGGYQYVNASFQNPSPFSVNIDQFILSTNIWGAVTTATVGTTPFTIANLTIGSYGSTVHNDKITCTAASTLTPGMYFNFYVTPGVNTNYTPYYIINGVGTAPLTGTPVPIYLTGTETAEQVKALTVIYINKFAFGVPDLRGFYIRGWNNGAVDGGPGGSTIPHDDDVANRFAGTVGHFPIISDNIGTRQEDQNYVPGSGGISDDIALNYVIKY